MDQCYSIREYYHNIRGFGGLQPRINHVVKNRNKSRSSSNSSTRINNNNINNSSKSITNEKGRRRRISGRLVDYSISKASFENQVIRQDTHRRLIQRRQSQRRRQSLPSSSTFSHGDRRTRSPTLRFCKKTMCPPMIKTLPTTTETEMVQFAFNQKYKTNRCTRLLTIQRQFLRISNRKMLQITYDPKSGTREVIVLESSKLFKSSSTLPSSSSSTSSSTSSPTSSPSPLPPSSPSSDDCKTISSSSSLSRSRRGSRSRIRRRSRLLRDSDLQGIMDDITDDESSTSSSSSFSISDIDVKFVFGSSSVSKRGSLVMDGSSEHSSGSTSTKSTLSSSLSGSWNSLSSLDFSASSSNDVDNMSIWSTQTDREALLAMKKILRHQTQRHLTKKERKKRDALHKKLLTKLWRKLSKKLFFGKKNNKCNKKKVAVESNKNKKKYKKSIPVFPSRFSFISSKNNKAEQLLRVQ